MTRCDRTPTGTTERGRGTGKPTLSPGSGLNRKGKEKEGINPRDKEFGVSPVPRPLFSDDDPAALERFLADNPAMTVRDWKGKGFTWFNPFDKDYVSPSEPRWDELDREEVRRLATRNKARFLTKAVRMAAARDSGLEWDERTRSYRLKPDATPAPSTAKERRAQREGASKVRGESPSRPAWERNVNANPKLQSKVPPALARIARGIRRRRP